MRVFCDGFVFENSAQRGIQRYFRELMGRLSGRLQIEIALRAPAQTTLPQGCRVHLFPAPRTGRLARFVSGPRRRAQDRRRAALVASCDVQHYTFFEPPAGDGPPEVVTVHDMILERFPDLFDARLIDRAIREKRDAIERATLCIAISESTADDLRTIYPGCAEKVRVVHHGVDHLRPARSGATPARPAGVPDGPYALFVGDRAGYKNFRVVLEALAERRWPSGLSLVVAGPPFGEGDGLTVRRLGVEGRVVHVGRAPDSELVSLYAHASAAVVPSLWEGFGFPALEAQTLGAPVVCSRIPVFSELLRDSAAFFDPRRPEDLAETMAMVAAHDVRDRLRDAGRRNAAGFTWDRCAERTLGVYDEAVGAGRAPRRQAPMVARVG